MTVLNYGYHHDIMRILLLPSSLRDRMFHVPNKSPRNAAMTSTTVMNASVPAASVYLSFTTTGNYIYRVVLKRAGPHTARQQRRLHWSQLLAYRWLLASTPSGSHMNSTSATSAVRRNGTAVSSAGARQLATQGPAQLVGVLPEVNKPQQ